MDECGRTLCGGDSVGGLVFLAFLYWAITSLYDKVTGKKKPVPPQPLPVSPMKAVEEAEEREWNKQVYAATKLVYGEPRYAALFNKYPEERKRQHIDEVATYVPEIWEIDKFIERLRQMPTDERAGYEAKAEFQLRRKGELLQKVYRELA